MQDFIAHRNKQKTGYFTFFKDAHTYTHTHDSFNNIIGAAFIIKSTPIYSELFACMSIIQFNKKAVSCRNVMCCIKLYKWAYEKKNVIVMFQI